MYGKTKRIIALLLAAVMLLLCGCEKQNGGEKSAGDTNAPAKGALTEKLANVHYKGDYKVMSNNTSVTSACFTNGRFYYSVYKESGEGIDLSKELRSCLADGTDDGVVEGFAVTGEEYFAPETVIGTGIYRIYPGSDCLYIVEYTRANRDHYILRQIDYSGNEISSVEYENERADILRGGDLAFDGDGNMYYSDFMEGLSVFSPDGTELFHAKEENRFDLIPQANGSAPLVVRQRNMSNDSEILSVNLEKKCFEEKMRITLPERFFGGAEGFDFTYVCGTALYGASVSTGETVPIFILANGGIFKDTLAYVLPYEGGLVCVDNDSQPDVKDSCWGLTVLKQYEGGYSDEKTVLTLASGSSDISSVIYNAIIKFNRTSTDYAVEIKDYSVYDTGDSYAGSSVLNTEILAGKTPDMFITDAVDSMIFADRGILEDLLPYIDADTELGGRDALVWPVFEAMLHRENGALYEIAPGFNIVTAVGDAGRIGGDSSIKGITSVLEKMPEDSRIFNAEYSRWFALFRGTNICINDYVDWENGTCSFNSPEFEEFLTFTKDYFPEESAPWSGYYEEFFDLRDGKNLLMSVTIADFQAVSLLENLLEDNAAFIGWPGSKSVICDFSTESGLAMCAASKHKEAAWEFMRTVLLEETQLSKKMGIVSLPTNRRAFKTELEAASITPEEIAGMVENEEGEKVFPYGKPVMSVVYKSDGSRVTIYKLTEEQVSTIWKLIQSPATWYGCDDELWVIIEDEASSFFDGRITAAEAAAAIQRRAEIYIAERK